MSCGLNPLLSSIFSCRNSYPNQLESHFQVNSPFTGTFNIARNITYTITPGNRTPTPVIDPLTPTPGSSSSTPWLCSTIVIQLLTTCIQILVSIVDTPAILHRHLPPLSISISPIPIFQSGTSSPKIPLVTIVAIDYSIGNISLDASSGCTTCRLSYIIVEFPGTQLLRLRLYIPFLPLEIDSSKTGCTLLQLSRHSCSSSGNTSSSNTLASEPLALRFFLEPLAPCCVASCLFGPLALVAPLASCYSSVASCDTCFLFTASCHVLYSGAVLLSLSPHLMDFSDPLLHFAL